MQSRQLLALLLISLLIVISDSASEGVASSNERGTTLQSSPRQLMSSLFSMATRIVSTALPIILIYGLFGRVVIPIVIPIINRIGANWRDGQFAVNPEIVASLSVAIDKLVAAMDAFENKISAN